MNKCLYCGKETNNRKYCSHSCVFKNMPKRSPWNKGKTKSIDKRLVYNRNHKINFCLNCRKEISYYKKCCSYSCAIKYRWKNYSEEELKIIIEKLRLAHLGKKLSEEHRKNLSLAKKGKKLSEEHRKNVIKAITGNTRKPLSEEHKNKLREKSRIARSKQIFPVQDTSIEIKIQDFLKELNIIFLPHYYINIKHAYQVDIFIPFINLIIECDGNYWHYYPLRKNIDNIRTQELINAGFKVLRLWESEINSLSINEFKNKISEYIGENTNVI